VSDYPSKVLADAVEAFSGLKGIGRRGALRMVLELLEHPKEDVVKFSDVLKRLTTDIHYCEVCFNMADTNRCRICNDPKRDTKQLCVVADIRDVMAIEQTQQFKGCYHVLGGIISPMEGKGPSDLTVDHLLNRIATGAVTEIIMALPATMEGDTTIFYIFKKINTLGLDALKLSTIARGIAIGDSLEYADEVTLGRSILDRTPYDKKF
jgi:recombination protein RecR